MPRILVNEAVQRREQTLTKASTWVSKQTGIAKQEVKPKVTPPKFEKLRHL
jgi:hypothetical protein